MRYEGVTADGRKIPLHEPMQVQLRMDEDAPAHSLQAVFPYEKQPALQGCNVYDDEETLIFGGIVDVQKVSIAVSGSTLSLQARSKAALLLDNEARPQTYENPSLKLLFQEHAAVYGLPSFLGKKNPYYWTYVIAKGTSEWQVFADFCLYCMDIVPIVTPEGVLDCTGERPAGRLLFGNGSGIPYTKLVHTKSPCKQLRQLWLQEKLGEGYHRNVVDLAAVQAGVQRTRYLTAASWQAQRKLKLAHRQSDEVQLYCPGGFVGALGMEAVVDSPMGRLENYTVAKLTYRLDDSGERCIVTLRTAV